MKGKQESSTDRIHFRKLIFNCTLEKEWSQASLEAIRIVQSGDKGVVKRVLAVVQEQSDLGLIILL